MDQTLVYRSCASDPDSQREQAVSCVGSNLMTRRLTVAQGIIRFLQNQYVERDGRQHRFFEGCFGIFGHGNVAGLGQALEQDPGLPYYLFRNEQAMAPAAVAFAMSTCRVRTKVCTSSIGP